MKAPLIEFKNVSKIFKKHEILNDINLTIKENEIIGMVGRSGSGKTTLFRLLLNIYKPSKGQIYINGKKIRDNFKENFGFASQENSFYPRLTVIENLNYFGRMYNLSHKTIDQNIAKLLKFMQLEEAENVWARNLSGGMKRRLDLAIALIHNPKILILDEPTTGLDVLLNESIWSLIMKIHSLGKTIIVSSHNLNEIEEHCSSIFLVNKGKIIDQKQITRLSKKYKIKSLEKIFRKISNDKNL